VKSDGLLPSGAVSHLVTAVLCLAQAAAAPEAARIAARAAVLLRDNQVDAAIQDLTRAAALGPRSAAVHLLLGHAYLAKAAPEFIAQAKAEFQQARELDPNQALASFYIAKIDLDLGRVSQAERELRQALERKAGEHYLLALLGEVRRRQGRPEEAIEIATKALAVGPEALPVHYYRALAYWDRRDETRALQDLQRVLESPFATVEAFTAAGVIHLHFDRLTQAESHFRKALELGKDHPEPRLRLAEILRRQRRFSQALSELDRLEASPQLSSEYYQKLLAGAAYERGLIHAAQNDPNKAATWFRKALEIDPEHPQARERLKP
jgi:tetratricopeptide (TPR) repeat protein